MCYLELMLTPDDQRTIQELVEKKDLLEMPEVTHLLQAFGLVLAQEPLRFDQIISQLTYQDNPLHQGETPRVNFLLVIIEAMSSLNYFAAKKIANTFAKVANESALKGDVTMLYHSNETYPPLYDNSSPTDD